MNEAAISLTEDELEQAGYELGMRLIEALERVNRDLKAAAEKYGPDATLDEIDRLERGE